MKLLSRLKQLKNASQGFTMIELLVVITILGILAVAVLSAINPLEQINRGRDTSTRSDAEQLYNAIDRFNAFQSYFPWDEGPQSIPTAINPWQLVSNDWEQINNSGCSVLAKLSDGTDCPPNSGTDEVKPAFVNRVADMGENWGLYAYKADNTGSTSMYLCFLPQSSAFIAEARTRCTDPNITLPADFPPSACDTDAEVYYICLP